MNKIGYQKTADGVYHMLSGNGNTKDIIRGIMEADKANSQYVLDFVKQIPGEDLETLCRNLWQFLKDNIPYREDPDGFQFIQSPGWLYQNRHTATGGTGKGGDCKSYSNFISGCLKCLGIPHFYRFITEDPKDDFHHVYICVPTTGTEYIVMDAVLPEFNTEVNYAKHEDRWADMTVMPQPAMAGIEGSQQEEYEKAAAWKYEEDKMKDPYFRDKMIKDVKAMLRADLYNHWANKNHIKYAEIRKRLIEKDETFAAFVTASSALMYQFWDETKAPFIDPVTRSLTVELDKKRNYVVTEMYRSLTEDLGFRDASLRALANLGVYFVYGISMAHMLDKSYNMVKYGQPWGPVDGVPYFDFNKKQFIRNGADADVSQRIELCLPYDGGVTRLAGVPFWNHYGFIMKNGADDAAVQEWVKKNPRPTSNLGIWKKTPTAADETYFITKCVPAYQEWLNGNAPGFPKPPAAGFGGAIQGTAAIGDYGLSATAIVAIVVAIVTAVSTIVGIIVQLVNAFKKGNIDQMPCPPQDFRMEFQAADGSYIGVAPLECGELKAKYIPETGQVICLTAEQLASDPANQAAGPAGGFFNLSGAGSSKMILAGGAALIATGLLISK